MQIELRIPEALQNSQVKAAIFNFLWQNVQTITVTNSYQILKSKAKCLKKFASSFSKEFKGYMLYFNIASTPKNVL